MIFSGEIHLNWMFINRSETILGSLLRSWWLQSGWCCSYPVTNDSHSEPVRSPLEDYRLFCSTFFRRHLLDFLFFVFIHLNLSSFGCHILPDRFSARSYMNGVEKFLRTMWTKVQTTDWQAHTDNIWLLCITRYEW